MTAMSIMLLPLLYFNFNKNVTGFESSTQCSQLWAAGKQGVVAAQDAVVDQGCSQKGWKHPASLDEEGVQGRNGQGRSLTWEFLAMHARTGLMWSIPCHLVIALPVEYQSI
jgi:hypothetical protein